MSWLLLMLACNTATDTASDTQVSATDEAGTESEASATDTEVQATSCLDEPGPGWSDQLCVLESSCGWNGDWNASYWGWSLDAGDLTGEGLPDLVVAAPAKDVEIAGSEVDGAGAVALYTHASFDAGTPPEPIWIEGKDAQQWVGHEVRVLPDRSGDGIAELVIGVRGDDSSETNAGAVRLIHGTASWVDGYADTAAAVSVLGDNPYERVGSVVEVGGDLDGDGLAELLLAGDHRAWDEASEDESYSTGAVRVLFGSDESTGTVMASDLPGLVGSGSDDIAGFALAAGDLDGDGTDDFAASAPQAASDYGRVFGVPSTLSLDGSPFEDVAPVQLEGHARYDGFGTSLAIGDVDGDGASELLVGSPYHDAPYPSGGRVDLYAGGADFFATVNPEPRYTWTGEFDEHDLGSSVSLHDLTGDGTAEVVFASEDANTHLLTKSGRVYVFVSDDGLTSGDAGTADAIIRGSEVKTYLGRGQAFADMNGDGIDDLWLGSGYHDGDGTDQGIVALFPGGGL